MGEELTDEHKFNRDPMHEISKLNFFESRAEYKKPQRFFWFGYASVLCFVMGQKIC